jgi:hypothetical protein
MQATRPTSGDRARWGLRSDRVRRHAHGMNPPGRQLHHEQHVQALGQARVDTEEVTRHNPSARADRSCRHVSPRGGVPGRCRPVGEPATRYSARSCTRAGCVHPGCVQVEESERHDEDPRGPPPLMRGRVRRLVNQGLGDVPDCLVDGLVMPRGTRGGWRRGRCGAARPGTSSVPVVHTAVLIGVNTSGMSSRQVRQAGLTNTTARQLIATLTCCVGGAPRETRTPTARSVAIARPSPPLLPSLSLCVPTVPLTSRSTSVLPYRSSCVVRVVVSGVCPGRGLLGSRWDQEASWRACMALRASISPTWPKLPWSTALSRE